MRKEQKQKFVRKIIHYFIIFSFLLILLIFLSNFFRKENLNQTNQTRETTTTIHQTENITEDASEEVIKIGKGGRVRVITTES